MRVVRRRHNGREIFPADEENQMKTAYAMRERASWEDEPFDTSLLPDGWAETIILLIESEDPVDDGDFPSKIARNALIEYGYAAKAVLHGEQVGTVATYKGGYLYCQLVDRYPNLKAAIEFRRANPNFLNDLWKSQREDSAPTA